ncbi:hypothetical protein BDQ17DRAFT_1495491 [Cyathus striatus]|nr:hypothetical protein BDQ17DRAFT_1495491 [Cyathus striatus]
MSKPSSTRGRPVVSKPLSASASTAASRAREAASKDAKSSSTSASASTSTSTMKISNVTRTTHKITLGVLHCYEDCCDEQCEEPNASGTGDPPMPAPVGEDETAAAPVPSDASNTAPTPTVNASEPPTAVNPDDAPKLTSDPLQVTAQAYPWLYMSNTLEACFKTAEQNAERDIETRTAELESEESEIADQRDRFETERVLDFYDELGTDTFTKEAPLIMQSFLSHGDACSRIETEALELASRVSQVDTEDSDPLQVGLQAEATQLETNITRLTTNESSSAREQIVGVFAACLPVLRARISNLSMAQDLVETATENLSLTLRMESLGIE